MKTLIKKLSKRNKVILSFFGILSTLYLVSFIFLTFGILNFVGIESMLRYVIIGMALLYFFIYIIVSLLRIIQKRYKNFIIWSIFTVILIVLFSLGTYYMDRIYNILSSFGENETTKYTSYLITMSDNEFDKDSEIGMISNTNDTEGYVLANKIIENENLENEITNYDDYLVMLEDLYDGTIDAIFVKSNYVTFHSGEEKFANIKNDTKILFEYSEELKNEDTQIVTNKDFSEPITFLIMGVDSADDDLNANAAFNGDTLMMITFNPHTLNATMLSIPRDTLVPIACRNGAYAKINSSAAYGTECVIDTVEELTNAPVDYYVKINFKGVVELVDALGGIEVDVEKPDYNDYGDYQVCEQDSSRDYSNLICMGYGVQNLNGEQALAYARNRYQYTLSDIDRNRHQQEVVTAIANKMVTLSSFDEFELVLQTISNNIYSNMTNEQILSGYDVMKDALVNSFGGSELINIEHSFLEVYNLNVYLTSSSSSSSSSLGYYQDSIDDITHMMNVNLEKEEPNIIKSASFDINEPYEQLVAGEGLKKESTTSSLPLFIGLSESEARSKCSSYQISCTFTTVDSDSDFYNSDVSSGLVGSQNVRSGTLVNNLSKMTLYINGQLIEKPKENNTEDSADSSEENNSSTDEVDPEDPVDENVEEMIE